MAKLDLGGRTSLVSVVRRIVSMNEGGENDENWERVAEKDRGRHTMYVSQTRVQPTGQS